MMRKAWIVAFVGIGFVLLGQHAVAATPSGLSVSPATQNITVAPGQTDVSFSTLVTNSTSAPVIVSVGARDFTSLDQTGSLSFFDSTSLLTNAPHSLANTMTIGFTQIALGAGQGQIVPISIVRADKLAAGGHYAAIIFKQTGLGNRLGNKVVVNQEVASLIFVTTFGGGTQSTDLQDVLQNSFVTKLPERLSLVLENNGNTQTIPRGFAQVIGPENHLVNRGLLNADSSLILPASKRLYTIDLPSAQGHNWPGLYHLKVMYRYDGETDYHKYQKTFLYINLPLFITIIGLILLGCLWIIWRFLPKSLYRLYKK